MEEGELPSGVGNKWEGLDCTGSPESNFADKSLLMNVRHCSYIADSFATMGP